MTPTAVSQIIEALCKLVVGLGLAYWLVKAGADQSHAAAGAITGVTVGTIVALAYMLLNYLMDRSRNTGFQVLFHSPPGVLFTFPSQYYALSVTKEYLALGGGPPDFLQGSTCLAVLWIPLAPFWFHVRDFHPLWSDFPDCSITIRVT